MQKLKTWSRFKAPDLPDGGRADLAEALQTQAFVPAISATSLDARSGWVLPDDMLSADFTDLRWFRNQYACFALRTDKKNLPSKLKSSTIKQRVAAWCLTAGRERCPVMVKAEIKEQVEFELAQRVLPQTTLTQVVWNTVTGHVYLGSTADGVRDTFLKLFRRSFGEAQKHDVEDVAERRLADLDTEEPDLHSAFLRYLWYQVQRGGVPGVTLSLGDRAVLSNVAEDKPSVTLRGDAEGSAVSAAALRMGIRMDAGIRALKIEVRKDDREYVFVVGKRFTVNGTKLPMHCKTGDDAMLYEQMFLIEDLMDTLDAFATEFAYLRAGDGWQAYLTGLATFV